ncbi:homing endonuclease [Caulobacter phage KcrB]|nr:homing endonuclease [Caulobacter phage RW]WCA46337.1 homing endonuclease [Caulobacter phage KcrB]WCD56272.1 homing endonuclease [Caulobacter phage RLK]WNV48064.1 homing endonuclease [Caulobacter phage GB2A]
MKLTKAQRAELRKMFGGRCAYCGCDLGERWHADHFEPVIRVMTTGHPEDGFHQLHPERNTIENFRPSCAPCNIDKHRMTIEAWRKWLGVRLEALKKTPGFKLLSAHGLIAETGSPVVFHFERAALEKEARDV